MKNPTLKKLTKNKILAKNFFLFMLLLKKTGKKQNLNIKLFIKKAKTNVYTILRSPYRHKLARHQLSIKRYVITLNIDFKIKKLPVFSTISDIFFFTKKINLIKGFLETNIVHQTKIKIEYPFKFKNNFLLDNYK